MKFKIHPENKDKAKVITSGGEIIIEDNLKTEEGKGCVLIRFKPTKSGERDYSLSHSHALTRMTEL